MALWFTQEIIEIHGGYVESNFKPAAVSRFVLPWFLQELDRQIHAGLAAHFFSVIVGQVIWNRS